MQAEEVTEELLTFHQALNKMQEMEEVLVDEYKAYLEVGCVDHIKNLHLFLLERVV